MYLVHGNALSVLFTLVVAALVRTALDSLFALFADGVDTRGGDAILDAARAGTRIITFLASFLTINFKVTF